MAASNSEDWSDHKCRDIANRKHFPAKALDRDVQKQIVKRFLNYYMGGAPKPFDACDIIMSTIAIMPSCIDLEKCLMPRYEFKTDGNLFQIEASEQDIKQAEETELKNHSKPQASTSKNKTTKEIIDVPADEHIHWGVKKPTTKEYKAIEYGIKENLAFNASCNELLSQWDTNVRARIKIKLLFGYIALVLLRLVKKTPKLVMKFFQSEKLIFNFTLIGLEGSKFTVPHKRCLWSCFTIYKRKRLDMCILFAKLILIASQPSKPPPLFHRLEENFGKIALNTSVLIVTSWHGMGIINMLQTLKLKGYNIKCVVEVTTCDETRGSWLNIISFVKRYMMEHSIDVTYPWARLIEPNSLLILSCKNNFALACILAVFIDTEYIWSSPWAIDSNRLGELDKFKKIGKKMICKYNLAKK